jgi:hypothetical protein
MNGRTATISVQTTAKLGLKRHLTMNHSTRHLALLVIALAGGCAGSDSPRHSVAVPGASFGLMQPTSPAPAAPQVKPADNTTTPKPVELKPFAQDIPTAAFKFDMLPIPSDESKGIKAFYISKTEITWEAFDVYLYGLDETAAPAKPASAPQPDAITRPSKPYLPPDRGFGHEGFAAITMSFKNAENFCAWLSAKTGRKYRLPTENEWEYACRAGATGPYFFGDNAKKLGDYAWFAANGDDVAHAVGKKKPNDWGLYDMLGNVEEWCSGRDGKPVLKGGSYRDDAEALKITAHKPNSPSLNAADPQVPKSKWWLANGPHVGFRVVCEPEGSPPPAKP